MRYLLLAILTCLALGCGGAPKEKVVAVRGTVTQAGAPLTVAGADIGLGMVQIQFFRIDEAGVQTTDPESAKVSVDGKFEIQGKDGRGIKPGKYRIAIRQWDPYPQTDKLGGKFDEKSSPIIREITGETELSLDVSKPEG